MWLINLIYYINSTIIFVITEVLFTKNIERNTTSVYILIFCFFSILI